jgi:hypothetical protein
MLAGECSCNADIPHIRVSQSNFQRMELHLIECIGQCIGHKGWR